MKKYIEPNIIECNKLEDANKQHLLWSNDSIDIGALRKQQRCLIFAEPGYGKSRLLQQIFEVAQENNEQCAFIDLKSISSMDFDTLFSKIQVKSTSSFDDKDPIISTGFDIENRTGTLCFDALDEVKIADLGKVYAHIDTFAREYQEFKIVVSTRTNGVEKYKNLIKQLKFKYYKISKFTDKQLSEYLNNYLNKEILDTKRNKIIKAILFSEENTVFIPRYITYLVEAINKEPDDFTDNIKRIDIMESVLSDRLKAVEPEKEYEERILLRVLGKIALCMEINQTKQISVEEFVCFFEEIDSKVCERMYFSKPISEVYNHTVLKYNQGSIAFENAEMQEYLAARELNLLSNPDDGLFNIVTDNPSRIVYPYWSSTLSYYIEMKPRLYLELLKYDYRTDIEHQSSLAHIVTHVDQKVFSSDELKEIADLIIDFYQKGDQWLPYEVLDFLSKNASVDKCMRSLEKLVKDGKEHTYIKMTNLLKVISESTEGGQLSEGQKGKLLALLKNAIKKNQLPVVQQHVIKILMDIGTLKDLKEVYKYIDMKDDLVERTVIDGCATKYAESNFAINLFMAQLIKDRFTLAHIDVGIANIKKAQYMCLLLNKLLDNKDALTNLLEMTSREFRSNIFVLSEIRRTGGFKKSLEAIIEKILLDSTLYYYSHKSCFFAEIIRQLDRYDPLSSFNLFIKTIESDTRGKNAGYMWHYHDRSLVILLSKANESAVLDFLEKSDPKGDVLESFAVTLINYDDKKYELHVDEIERRLKHKVVIEQKSRNENALKYITFKEKLHLPDDENKFSTEVFLYFIDNHEILLENDKENKVSELRELAYSILDDVDPSKMSIKYGDREGSYTYTSVLGYIHNVIGVLYVLNEDLGHYRNKIIALLPFMSLYSSLDYIVETLGLLTKTETEYMIECWNAAGEAALKYNGTSLLRLINEMGIKSKEVYAFVHDLYKKKLFKDHEIEMFIETLYQLGSTEDFFLEQQKVYKQDTSIGLVINKILITGFKNHEAILWRFNKIKRIAQKLTKRTGVHSVGAFEDETLSMRMAKPILTVSFKYEENIVDLIEYSLEKYREDDEFYEYAAYIWKIVKAFYENSIDVDPYLNLGRLQSYSNKPSEDKGLVGFKFTIKSIIDYAMTSHSKRNRFIDSVAYLNSISKLKKGIENADDLKRMLQSVINEDLKRWIEREGAYKLLGKLGERNLEDLAQKTMKSQIELSIRKRVEGALVVREPQSLSDKRIDFMITYGFAGTQLIELKLLKNPIVQNVKKAKAYKKKLIEYVEGNNADYVIYLVLRITEEKDNLSETIDTLIDLYKDEKRIIVMGIDGLATGKLK